MGRRVVVVQRGLEKRRLSAENLRLREALSLYKVSEAITASLSLDEVMATVIDSSLSEVRADVVATWLEDGEGGFSARDVARTSIFDATENMGCLNAAAVQSSPSPPRASSTSGAGSAAGRVSSAGGR